MAVCTYGVAERLDTFAAVLARYVGVAIGALQLGMCAGAEFDLIMAACAVEVLRREGQGQQQEHQACQCGPQASQAGFLEHPQCLSYQAQALIMRVDGYWQSVISEGTQFAAR
jgi:hypothetical protein